MTKYIPLLIACVVGAIAVAPHFLAVYALGSAYQGYPFLYQANEDLYMARTQEVIDGHPLVGSPLLYEYKNSWPTVIPVGENIDAIPSEIFHTPIQDTIVGVKFLFPALLFLLVYMLTFALLTNKEKLVAKLTAIASGLAVVLGYDLIDYSHLQALIASTQTHTLVWTRPVNPITGILLLVPLLLIVWKILNEKTKWLFIVGGVLLGGTICYFFSWVVGGSMVGLCLLFALYQKNFPNALRLVGLLAVSFVLQIPYWYHSVLSLRGPGGKVVALKNGAFYEHSPIINKFLLAASVLFFLCLLCETYKRRSIKTLETWWYYCGLLLLSCWLAFNEQVITGITVWPYHFVQFTIPVLMIVLLVVGYNFLSPKLPLLYNFLLACLIAVCLLMGLSSALSYRYSLSDFLRRQTYMPIFSWLNTNTSVDCVVLVSEKQEDLSMLVPAFTHCDTYMSTYTPFNVPNERIMHNFLVFLRLQNIQPQNAKEYLQTHPQAVNAYMYTSIDQSIFTGLNAETQSNIDAVVPAYQQFYKGNFEEELKQYKIDYLLTTSTSTLPSGVTLKKETSSGALTLYKVQ